jgi:hypothetical protein
MIIIKKNSLIIVTTTTVIDATNCFCEEAIRLNDDIESPPIQFSFNAVRQRRNQ